MHNETTTTLNVTRRKCAMAGAALAIELRRDADVWRPGGEPFSVEDLVALAVTAAHLGRIVLAAGGAR